MSFTFGTPAATPTNASLVAALDRRLGTAGAIQPVMVGAAGEGWRKSGTRAIWSDTGFAAAAKKSSVNFLRMPGGTAVDYWDWTTGQIVLDGPQPAGGEVTAGNPVPGFTLHDWLDQCVAIGAEPMIEFNVCAIPARLAGGTARFLRGSNPIPTSPYVTGAYHDDVAVLVADNMALLVEAISYMQAKGTVGGVNYSSWTPKYIELGNEIYLGGAGNPGPSASFGGRGAQYAYLAYQMALAIRTKAAWAAWAPMSVPGHIRIYACGGLASYGEKWQNDMCAWRDGAGHSVLDVVDGFTFHGMYWAQPADPTSDANAYKIINAGIAKSNSPQYVTSPVAGKTTLPAGKSAVYTEYNFMPDTGGTIAGKWVHGVAMAAATLTQIDDPAVEMTCAQAFVGPANGTYPRVVSSGGSYKLQPWGCAIALLCLASAGATKYQKISFSAGAMGSGSLAPGQGLLGAAFQTPGGTWSACIVNGDSAAYTVAFAAGSPFHGSLTGAQMATTITDTSVALPSNLNGSMGLGSALAIPAYSVTYIQGTASTRPVVTGLDVTAGAPAGGTAIQIAGSGFSAGSATVSVGGNPATSVVVVSDSQINCTTPAGTGTVDVIVTTVNGASLASPADQFTYTASTTPVITGVSPNTGSVSGGTLVTVTGRNLSSVTSVAYGATSVGVIPGSSDTTLSLRTPPHAVGIYHITATNGSGTSTGTPADLFTFTQPNSPTVTGVSPNAGLVGGGTVITVAGTNFVAGSTTVAVGGVAATGVTVASPTSLQCTTPAGTGTVNVIVTTGNGSSPAVPADQFTYSNPRPVVTGIVPTSGPTGGANTLKISGTGFAGATAVAIGANPATGVTVVSDTEIDCTVPAGLAGTVDVVVTGPGGVSQTGVADQYTYNTGGLTSINVPGPRNIQTGDLIELFTAWAGTSITMTTPAGYTATTMVTGTGFRMQHFWKIATATDAANSAAGTFTVPLVASSATEIVAVLRADYNEDQTNPFDPAPSVSGQANASSSTIAASAGITTGHPNGRLVVFLVTTAAAGGSPPAITLPANFVARGSGRTTTNSAGINLSILTGDINLGTAGATGAIAGTAATACVNGGMAVVVKASQ